MKLRLLWIFAMGAIALGQPAPSTMTKLVVRFQSPDVPKTSFAAQPKTMYRAGSRYCRIEEMPDAEHGIHGLIVINEPDIWMANRLNMSVRHQVDPGPTFNCRMPIFVDENGQSAADTSNPLTELEFGRELAYFEAKGAESSPGPALQGKPTKAYTLKIAESQLFLFTSSTLERPAAIARQRGTKREVYWYGSYEELPFDAKLFAKPEGKIEEIK